MNISKFVLFFLLVASFARGDVFFKIDDDNKSKILDSADHLIEGATKQLVFSKLGYPNSLDIGKTKSIPSKFTHEYAIWFLTLKEQNLGNEKIDEYLQVTFSENGIIESITLKKSGRYYVKRLNKSDKMVISLQDGEEIKDDFSNIK